jgi:general L-amino acid transport system permease protein
LSGTAHDPARRRALLGQGALLAAILGAGWFAAASVSANLARAGIGIDFGFFFSQAGFDIADAPIPYTASDTYARAFVVGILNTLSLAAASVVAATIVGVLAGVVLVSGNPLAEGAMRAYVGAMRNLPKLVLLLAVYVALVGGLPNVRGALHPLPGVFVSNRGLHLPAPTWQLGVAWHAGMAVAGVLVAWLLARWAGRRRTAGMPAPPAPALAAAALCAGILLPLVPGGAAAWSVPVLEGFDFTGGALVSLAFVALWLTLTFYHGAQIAEVVRGGIEAVPRGQWLAALALGLTPRQRMWNVILPQVARSVLPPLTNQYLNLLKNTSIGLAVGYTEFLAVGGTTINQSLRSVEVMTLVMSVYLAIGLLVAHAMNLLNARLRAGLQ